MHSCSPAAILVAAVKNSSPAVPSDPVKKQQPVLISSTKTAQEAAQYLQIVENKEVLYRYFH